MFDKLIDLLPQQEEPKPNKFTIYMGNAIKTAREEAGLSQDELAKKIFRRRATLSDIETGKADVDAGTLWLFSAYLKKPLSYFYPPYARENMRPEEMGPLEHELQMHFMQIKEDVLKMLVIQIVKTLSKFDPNDHTLDYTKPVTEEEELARAKFEDLMFGPKRKKKMPPRQ
ncbi:MAG: helix-turn-helix domain-containing protein [Chloroflexi bacterium]|nr:helix-turn-helix domain-containing protein [Chloroflexota bacterium]